MSSRSKKHGTLIRNLSITFSETVLTKALNFLVILMLTRSLGPADYGKYSFLFVTVALCSALFDFGMENTAVRFAARDGEKKDAVFGLYLTVKLAILLLLILGFLTLGPVIFNSMGKGEMSAYMPYLLAGLLGESLFFVNDTWLQANRQFKWRALLNVTRYTITALYVAILMTLDYALLNYVLWLYLIPLVFSLFFIRKYIHFLKAYAFRMESLLFRDILDYERWMFFYSIANNLLGRIDFFLLAFWVSYAQIGIYNAAFQLCSIVAFLPFVLGKVLLPTLSELASEEVFRTVDTVRKTTILVGTAALAAVPLSPYVVPFLLGPEYVDSVPVLQWLLLAFIASLLSMPYEQALYALGKPKALSIGRYLQLGLMILINILLIPHFGIMAAAWATFIGRVLYLIYTHKLYREVEQSLPGSGRLQAEAS